MPLPLDFLRRIINVKWGGDVIVVFVDGQGNARSTFRLIEDKAELLQQFPINMDGVEVTKGVAYKVGRDAGEFMETTAPSFNGAYNIVGHAIFVFVFAIGESIESGLARAKAGAALAFECAMKEYSGDQDPSKAHPPGLLWSVGLNHVPRSRKLTWKTRYGAHRTGISVLLPNDMVQCYPLSAPWTLGVGITYTGYSMRIYRLDADGTGQSYGTSNPDNSSTGTASIDPVWHREISSAGNNDAINHGIQFADPPSLINTDVPNAHDHA